MMTQSLLRIGQVCDLLRPEYSDISISKLRFLEDQGLVTPERTPGGYRMYTQKDIRELRYILQMQRDEFLPLKVIRDEVKRRIAEGRVSAGRGGASRVSIGSSEERLTLMQVCERAGVGERFVDECIQFDMVKPARSAGEFWFGELDCNVITCAARMARAGIDVRLVRQVRSAVTGPAGLVEQYATPRLQARSMDARDQSLRAVEQVTETIADLMRHLFVREVRTSLHDLVVGASAGVSEDGARRGSAPAHRSMT